MLFAGAAIIFGFAINDGLSGMLEFAVGVMLVGLGGHIIYRLWRDRIHFHVHSHGEEKHFHAHSHAGEVQEHTDSSHDHDHKPFPVRTLLVGMMHGMAGSAALLVLTASTAPTMTTGFLYVVLFGIGSMFGMAGLSAIIAVPIAYSARMLTWANRSIQGATGLGTMALGLFVMYETQLNQLFS